MPQPANCTRCGRPRARRPNNRYEGGCGLCGACYHAAQRAAGGGPVGEPRNPMPATCRDCGEPTSRNSAKGRCGRCYRKWRRAGSPPDPEPLTLVPVLRSGWYGYSPVTGTARLDAAS